MKLLVDECCDAVFVATLRSGGHDVRYVAEGNSGTTDEDVLAISVEEGRVVVTEDKDFGELVFRKGKHARGIIVVRMAKTTSSQRAARVQLVLANYIDRFAGTLTVVSSEHIRIRPLPH